MIDLYLMMPLEKIYALCHEDGDCLIWDRSVDARGIPRRTIKLPAGKATTLMIRRAVWEHKHGPIPQGKRVSVACGNPRCLEHLELITPGEVIRRTAKKPGVQAKRRVGGLKTRERSKLNMEKARYIRESDKTLAEIAHELGIGMTTASRARRGLSWKDYSNPFAGLGV